jgi:hypothetical protein
MCVLEYNKKMTQCVCVCVTKPPWAQNFSALVKRKLNNFMCVWTLKSYHHDKHMKASKI